VRGTKRGGLRVKSYLERYIYNYQNDEVLGSPLMANYLILVSR
jgi:hypothetical protein